VVLEAFAAGVPVFATDLGGVAEIVRDGINGELFRRDDVQDLAQRLQRAVEDPGILARYRDGIGEVKSIESSVRELEAIYRGDGVS
jgi:glycosyltransferase involved in cell wall biosynthesis